MWKLCFKDVVIMLRELLIMFVFLHHYGTEGSFHWQVNNWDACAKRTTCREPHIKTRRVECVDNKGIKHDSVVCRKEVGVKPIMYSTCVRRECVNEMKRYLEVKFTSWSQCTAISTTTFSKIKNFQHLETPSASCQKPSETVPYIKTRNSTCSIKYRFHSIKLASEDCSAYYNVEAVQFNLCFVACSNPCLLSKWGQWQTCNKCKQPIKFRTREYASLGEQKNCPRIAEIKVLPPMFETENVVSEYKLSEWNRGEKVKTKQSAPNFVVKSREITCISKPCQSKAPEIPLSKLFVKEIDCRLTEWTEWSIPCTKDDKQTRRKKIKELPSFFGASCETKYEQRPCVFETKALVYTWRTGEWSICENTTLPNQPLFGKWTERKSYRHVFCVLTNGTLHPQAEYLCSGKEKPKREKACAWLTNVPCLYSGWSLWSGCYNKISRRKKEAISNSHGSCNAITQKKRCGNSYAWFKSGNSTFECLDLNGKVFDKMLCANIPKSIVSECRKNSTDYFWHVQPWKSCVAAAKDGRVSSSTANCVVGFQYRDILCVKEHEGNTVNDSYCQKYVKEKTSKKCQLCKEYCVLTPWSDWYPKCSALCSSVNDVQPLAFRKRYILEHGNELGNLCPKSLIKTAKCHYCPKPHWVTKDYDYCLHNSMPKNNQGYSKKSSNLQNGVQVRGVHCSNGYDVINDGVCFDLDLPKPLLVRECEINWLNSCNLQPWSDWSPCSKKCGRGISHRSRTFSSLSCSRNKRIVHKESQICNIQPCVKYHAEYGEWSTCKSSLLVVQTCNSDHYPFKNVGEQMRNGSCVDQHGITADRYCEELFDEPILRKRSCLLPCPKDCSLTPWSTFTACSKTCGAGLKTRVRNIQAHSIHGGKECPVVGDNSLNIVQTVPCKEQECFDVGWHVGDWTTCVLLLANETCGVGVSHRNVTCYNRKTLQLADGCVHQLKPTSFRNCQQPCTDQCIFTEWSDWSLCTCGMDMVTLRDRAVVKSSSESCPHVRESKECNTCLLYEWVFTLWSSCILTSETHHCGMGFRHRMMDCCLSGNVTVHPKHCLHLAKQPKLQHCELQCKQQCAVTPWTEWSSCTTTCNTVTYQTRERMVISEHALNTCDQLQLKETLVCPVFACYNFTHSTWSECQPIYNNTCGVGLQRRAVLCERLDGNIVDLNHCVEYATGRERETQSCSVPCRNECVRSEWSEWSLCFGVCDHRSSPLLSYGFQTRARAVLEQGLVGARCEEVSVEKRKCSYPTCFSVNHSSKSICQRSDGLRLSYGCRTMQAFPCVCPLQHAVCLSSVLCECEAGYERLTVNSTTRCRKTGITFPKHVLFPDSHNISVGGIISISFATCFANCMFVLGLFCVCKRRNIAALKNLRSNNDGHLPTTVVTFNQCEGVVNLDYAQSVGRPRRLLLRRVSNDSSSETSSDFPLVGESITLTDES